MYLRYVFKVQNLRDRHIRGNLNEGTFNRKYKQQLLLLILLT